MSYTVTLPNGLEKKTVSIDNVTIDLFEGQSFQGGQAVELFPQYFTEANGSKPAPKVEEKLEVLTEAPSQVEVEVEIVAEDSVDFESMTLKELKAYAEDKGIELTSTKKKDIIAELA